MASEFSTEFFSANRIVKADLRAARTPREEDLERIKKEVAKLYDATEVILNVTVDDSLLSGYVLQIGDRVFDNSGRHAARIDHVDVVGDLERFDDVVGHDDRRGVQRIVELADQVGGDAERNRIKARERLVVHDERGVERNRTCERNAARHAARDLGGHQVRGAPQAHGIELHEHQIPVSYTHLTLPTKA